MSSKRNLFHYNPPTTVDNCFVTDSVLDWDGNEVLVIIVTNARNRLPKDVKQLYLYKGNKNATLKHTKAVRFFESIFAVKNYSRVFQCVNVSFQSTSSCNIASINTLNECTNFVEIREKFRGNHKRQWVIEMNHAWRIYLATYLCIDVLDGKIQNAQIFCRVCNC